MPALLAGLCLMTLAGFISLIIKDGNRSLKIGAIGLALGSAISIIPVINVLITGQAVSLTARWQVPFGAFNLEIDSLSAIFLILVFLICTIAAIYGCGYMAAYKTKRLGIPAFFFNILAASMALVLTARNNILFLVAWEIMSLSSYFLVTFHSICI
jgi:formate hydrogenlyase subunit 3/multisubunit Na+/H+ antiporter MnhD subunit